MVQIKMTSEELAARTQAHDQRRAELLSRVIEASGGPVQPSAADAVPGWHWLPGSPQEPGWYWYGFRGSLAIEGVIEVKEHKLIGLGVTRPNNRSQLTPVNTCNWRWAGPIPRPNEEAF